MKKTESPHEYLWVIIFLSIMPFVKGWNDIDVIHHWWLGLGCSAGIITAARYLIVFIEWRRDCKIKNSISKLTICTKSEFYEFIINYKKVVGNDRVRRKIYIKYDNLYNIIYFDGFNIIAFVSCPLADQSYTYYKIFK